jgi:hypothetical protein
LLNNCRCHIILFCNHKHRFQGKRPGDLRSRATWLLWGDSNTKFFIIWRVSIGTKKQIWSIQSHSDETVRGQEAIKAEAVSYFEQMYKVDRIPTLPEQVSTASLYPKLVTDAEASELFKQVTLSELKDILFHFKKERSPGPDGWTTEFFCHFFDLVGPDLLQMVEDTASKARSQTVSTPPSWH